MAAGKTWYASGWLEASSGVRQARKQPDQAAVLRSLRKSGWSRDSRQGAAAAAVIE